MWLVLIYSTSELTYPTVLNMVASVGSHSRIVFAVADQNLLQDKGIAGGEIECKFSGYVLTSILNFELSFTN